MKKLLLLYFLLLSLMTFAQTDCPEVNVYPLDVWCEGAENGSIYLNVSEGVPPYEYLWSTGDTTAGIQSLTPGEYHVTVTDSLGCETIIGSGQAFIEPVLIPDADGTTLFLNYEENGFSDDAVIQYGSEIVVCVTIEHSWMRDLEIKLTCPDSTSVVLLDRPGLTGGNINLGIPVQSNDNIPGIGYEYCWTMEAGLTLLETADLLASGETIPPGYFLPKESFDGLIDCPINGEWELAIEDGWASDNGYVFSWKVVINGVDNTIVINEGDADCIVCEEEYYCMDWLRDTIRNNSYVIGRLEKVKWGDRTIFVGIRVAADDNNYVVFFDCEGNVYLEYHPGFAPSLDEILNAEVYTNREEIWAPFDTPPIFFEDCQELTIDSIDVPIIDCYGGTTTVMCVWASGGFSPYEYLWTYEGETAGEEACLIPTEGGAYSLIVTDVNGSTVELFDAVVDIPAELTVDILLETDSLGNNCHPFINITGGTSPYSFDWAYDEGAGEIVVNASDALGCTVESRIICVVNDVVDDVGVEKVMISPNPTHGIFTISAESSNNESTGLVIRNIIGEIIFSQQYNTPIIKTTLDLSGWSSGVYLVELRNAGRSTIKKLILVD